MVRRIIISRNKYALQIPLDTTMCNVMNGVIVMVFSATFNNMSVTSWRSVLLVEEIGENHRPVASH